MLRSASPLPEDQIEVFSDVTWEAIQRRGQFFVAEDGDVLLDVGEGDDQMMIILSGQATLVYLVDGIPEPTAVFRSPGEVLNHSGLHLRQANPFRIDAAASNTRVVKLDRESVYDLIARDLSFAEFLYRDLSQRFQVAMYYLREQRQEPLIIRLAKRLLTITDHRDVVEYTQAELASIMAVTRISISKALKSLEEDGLIQRVERSLLTVDRTKLRAWLERQDHTAL